MAAGAANVTVNTQTNVTSTTAQFSSDGTPSGVLQPFPVLSDANRTPFFTGTNPGSVSITGGNVTASLAANQTLGTLTAITNTVNVAVTSALPAGTNALGSVTLSSGNLTGITNTLNTTIAGSIPAGTNTIGTVAPVRGSLTDRSGTITTGGTSQQIAGANTSRSYLLVVNPPTNTATLWLNFTTAAAASQPSIPILPGGSFVMESGYVSTEAVNVIAATTSMPFVAKEG